MVKLSTVVGINPRLPKGTDESQSVTFLAMASVSEEGKVVHQETRVLGDTKKGFTYFERGDVLLAKITPCFENGKAAHTDNLEHHVGFGSTEFHVLRAKPGMIDSKYLFYLVWNDQFRFLGGKSMQGAAGQKRVSTDFLKTFEIPLPPLEEQMRIAAILDKADALRRKRQQAIGLSEQFLKSVFLDMFGDPVTNPKGWELARIDCLCTIVRGSSPRPKGDPRYYSGPIPRLMVADLTRDGKYVTPKIDSLTEEGAKRSRPTKKGTVVMAVSGNVGLTSVLVIDACIHDGFIAFNDLDSSRILPEFLQELMMFLKSTHANRQAGAIFQNLTTSQIKEMIIPLPSLKHQRKYIDIASKVGSIEFGDGFHLLFNSLSQQAFSGQL